MEVVVVVVVGVVELFDLPEVTVVVVCLAGVAEVAVVFVGSVVEVGEVEPLPVEGLTSLPAVRFVGLSVLERRDSALLLGTVTLGREVTLLLLPVLPLKELPPPVVPARFSYLWLKDSVVLE